MLALRNLRREPAEDEYEVVPRFEARGTTGSEEQLCSSCMAMHCYRVPFEEAEISWTATDVGNILGQVPVLYQVTKGGCMDIQCVSIGIILQGSSEASHYYYEYHQLVSAIASPQVAADAVDSKAVRFGKSNGSAVDHN